MKKYLLGFLTIALAAGLSVFSFSCGGGSSSGGKCQTAIDSGVVADIIANCDATKNTAQENRDAGLKLIALNSGSDAKVFLSAVPSTDPLYGEAQYGLMVTDLQSLVKDVDSLIGMVMSLTSMTSVETQATGVDLWSMLGSMVDPIKAKLVLMDSEAAAVIANGYTVSTDPTVFPKVPIVLGTSGGQYYIKVDVQGKAGAVEARLVRIVANAGVGVIEFIAAHDLTIDLTSAMSNLSGLMDLLTGLTSGDNSTDVVKALRGLGWLLADNPTLLTKSAARWNTNMGDVPSKFTAAIEALRELDADIIATAVPTAAACQDVACLISSDAAINAGDQLFINAAVHVEIKMDTTSMLSTLNSLKTLLSSMAGITLDATATGITVDLNLTNSTILALTPMLMDPLGRIIPDLDVLLVKAEASINSGALITTAEINPVITALDPTLPTIPDGLLTINVKNLYNKPLRDITKTFACDKATTLPGTGSSCLAIEVESTDCTEAYCSNSYYATADGAHFAGIAEITSIGADGIAPKACAKLSTDKWPIIPTKGTIYVALGDASLNGVLSIDLTKLPAAVQTAEDANHTTADNYALWKCVNYVITDWAKGVEESTIGQSTRTYIDLVGGALPAGTVPAFVNCGAFK
ncbi:MAG: hypothetical protein PHE84_02840 [bacterium]|nr:hypothetical protein [bacterium]